MLERAPLVAGKPDWVVDLDEETGQTSGNGQEEHPERDPPGEGASTLRKLQAAIEQGVDQSDRDRSPGEREHGCSHRSNRVAGGSVAVGPEWLCQRIEGSPNEPECEQRRDERAQPARKGGEEDDCGDRDPERASLALRGQRNRKESDACRQGQTACCRRRRPLRGQDDRGPEAGEEDRELCVRV